MNRFLMIWGERTGVEAFPRRAPQARVDALAAAVLDVLNVTRPWAEGDDEGLLMTMTSAARRHYAGLYQAELNEDSGNTLVDSVLERRAPMLLRIAMLITLTDRQWMIEERQIEASLTWIRYASASAAFVLQRDGPRLANLKVEWAAGRISALLAARGFASRKELVVDCFGRHQPATIVDAAIARLIDTAPGTLQVEVQPRAGPGPGRPATVYRFVRSSEQN